MKQTIKNAAKELFKLFILAIVFSLGLQISKHLISDPSVKILVCVEKDGGYGDCSEFKKDKPDTLAE